MQQVVMTSPIRSGAANPASGLVGRTIGGFGVYQSVPQPHASGEFAAMDTVVVECVRGLRLYMRSNPFQLR